MYITYIVLDPTKPCKSISPLCSFLFTPIYVGKGTDIRANAVNEVIKNENIKPHAGVAFHKWCIGIRRKGFTEVPIVKLEARDEAHAFAMEEILTHHFGIITEGGSLYNARHGGDNWAMSSSTKRKLSEINTGTNNPNYGKTWSDSRRQKFLKTFANKRAAGETKRSADSMANTWAARKRTYEINSGSEIYTTNDLSKWCKEKELPLSAFKAFLKAESGIVKSKLRTSKVENWTIKYLN